MLKKKLGTPGSGAAMVKLLRMFMEQNSSDKCVELMEDYAMNGADGGATRTELMKACNLQPALPGQNEEAPQDTDCPNQAVSDDSPTEKPVPFLREALAVMTYMLDMKTDRIRAGDAVRMRTITKVTNPTAFLDSLVNAGHFHKF